MKRHALDSLKLEPKAKRPANHWKKTLDAFFSPRPRRTNDAVNQEPAAGGKEDAGSVNERKINNTENIIALSDEQEKVLKMVLHEGKNIFFTGSAGTGKSLLLREIIKALKKKYSGDRQSLAICASTGIAAQNIGGTTIHAWGAVTPGVFDIDKQLSFIKTCRPAHRRWKTTKVLIIDEVSMVDGKFFDLLAAIAKALRKTSRSFGGIQLVVTGDFFQLPPVTQSGKDVFFAFQSDAWKESIDTTIMLSQVFRQKDNYFVELLNELRRGEISPDAKQALARLSRPLPQEDDIMPTELFPLRAEVERANAARMSALSGQSHVFAARDSGPAAPAKRQKLLDNMMAVGTLELKVDAQVMLVKNVSETLVNGSIGRVLAFLPKDEDEDKGVDLFPLVEFRTFQGKETVLVDRDEFRAEDSEGKLLARRVQIPLILAWAMSIHKAQGQTIQRVKVDLSKVFEKGQSYVALSRAASMEGLQVLGFDARKVMAHPQVIEWSKTLEQASNGGADT